MRPRRTRVIITGDELVSIVALAASLPVDVPKRFNLDKMSPDVRAAYYKVRALIEDPPDIVRVVG